MLGQIVLAIGIITTIIGSVYWVSRWKTMLEIEQKDIRNKVDVELLKITKSLAEILKSVHKIETDIAVIITRQNNIDSRITRLEQEKK